MYLIYVQWIKNKHFENSFLASYMVIEISRIFSSSLYVTMASLQYL